MMKAGPAFAVLCGVLVTLLGCGDDGRPKLIEATGTLKLNGEPVADAMIYFLPEEGNSIMRPSRAKTDTQGRFTLGTYHEGDGIPQGNYRIGIEKRQLVGTLPADYDPQSPTASRLTYQWITPKELADPATSGLKALVTSGGLEPAMIELERPGKPQLETIGGQVRSLNR